MSILDSGLRRRKGGNVNVEVSTTLSLGYRKGWPGQMIQNLVTHAVFRVGGGEVRGYGMVDGTGQIVNDGDSVAEEHQQYTWYTPTLKLSGELAAYFVGRVKFQASQFSYTGVGGNCYTPIVKALNELRTLVKEGGNSTALVTDIDRVLTQLVGANYGMGTSLTNGGIRSGERLFQAIGANNEPKVKME